MTAAERAVVVAAGLLYAAIPFYGTFSVLDPSRPPAPALLGVIPAGIAAALAASAAVVCAWGAARRPLPRDLVAAELGGGSAIIVSALLGFDPLVGAWIGILVLGCGAAGLATVAYGRLPGARALIVRTILASALVGAALALAFVILRRPAALYAYDNGRAVGTFLNPNELAAYLLVVLGLATGALVDRRDPIARVLAATVAVVGTVALAWTFSRWGYLAAAAGAAVVAWALRDRRVWAGLAVAALVGTFLVAGPGRLHHNPRDDTSRLVAWTTGIRTFLNFPLTGAGAFAYNRTYEIFRPPEAPGDRTPVAYDAHSLPISYLADTGLAGFGALLLLWTVTWRRTRSALRGAARPDRALGLGLAAGLVALNVHVLVNTIAVYLPLSIQGCALLVLLAEEGRRADAR